jgi:hypothetical protein
MITDSSLGHRQALFFGTGAPRYSGEAAAYGLTAGRYNVLRQTKAFWCLTATPDFSVAV